MQGTDALVNIASSASATRNSIVRAAKEAGIQRAVFVSTTAIFTQLNAKSKQVRLAAETAIETSGLKYTILRPTMIYGSPRDRNMWRLIRFMRYSPIVPVFGDGNSLQQPIYVGDVAQAIVSCLCNDQTIGKSYNIAGKSSAHLQRGHRYDCRTDEKACVESPYSLFACCQPAEILRTLAYSISYQSRAGPAAE